jgi:hypothetical protein
LGSAWRPFSFGHCFCHLEYSPGRNLRGYCTLLGVGRSSIEVLTQRIVLPRWCSTTWATPLVLFAFIFQIGSCFYAWVVLDQDPLLFTLPTQPGWQAHITTPRFYWLSLWHYLPPQPGLKPDLHFLSSWDYRCEPLSPAVFIVRWHM